jgi:hypothetical protein
MPMLKLTARWTALAWDGIEHLDLRETDDEIVANSVVVGTFNSSKHGTRYEVHLSRDWVFRSLVLEQTDGRRLELSREGDTWLVQGKTAEHLAGCVDLDLSGSPFTNTLPIRRLTWPVGTSRTLRMAYVPFDTLVPFADGQIYTRLGPSSFHYQSEDGTFEQTISVDADGLVTDYPTLFAMQYEKRIAFEV